MVENPLDLNVVMGMDLVKDLHMGVITDWVLAMALLPVLPVLPVPALPRRLFMYVSTYF